LVLAGVIGSSEGIGSCLRIPLVLGHSCSGYSAFEVRAVKVIQEFGCSCHELDVFEFGNAIEVRVVYSLGACRSAYVSLSAKDRSYLVVQFFSLWFTQVNALHSVFH